MKRGLTLLEVLCACVMLTGLMVAGLSMLTSISGTRESRDAATWERSARMSISEIQRSLDRRFGESLPIEPVVLTETGFRSYRSENEFDELVTTEDVLSVVSNGRTRILVGGVSRFDCELDELNDTMSITLIGQCGRSVARSLRIGDQR